MDQQYNVKLVNTYYNYVIYYRYYRRLRQKLPSCIRKFKDKQ